jgi:hypothetical protein
MARCFRVLGTNKGASLAIVAIAAFCFALAGVLTISLDHDVEDYGASLQRVSLLDRVKPERYRLSVGWVYPLGSLVIWIITRLIATW